ncbi:MAG: IPT/TIG domain-containing protein, partial [Patescibacteria group bacterium]
TVRGVNLGDGGASALLFEDQPVRVDKFDRDREGQLGEVVGFVPNFGAGMARVLVQVGDQKSNPLLYEVRAFREQDRPQIGSVNPDRGPSGTYVTVAGTGFGAAGQGSVVVFEHKASGQTYFADTDFPAECGAGTWNDGLVVVKVPRGVDLGAAAGGVAAYKVYVKRGAAQVQSNAVDFGVAIAGQPAPGICKIDPNMRPTGGAIDIYGENFGAAAGNVIFWDANATQDVASWTAADVRAVGAVWEETGRHVSVAVPDGAVSGPVKVVRGADQSQSNGYDFIVGSCIQNRNQCPVRGQTCCQSGFYAGACQESCEAGARTAEYSWIFSTGNIPLVPDVVQCCGRNCPLANPLPSPAPWDGQQNSESVCAGALIRGTFTTNIDANRGNPEDNFILEKCSAEGDNPCAAFTEVHTGAVVRNGAKQAEFSFSGEHRPNLEPNATYQVRIMEGLVAMPDAEAGRDGGEMRPDPAMVKACGGERHARGTAYCFRFRTNDRECAIGAVAVAPAAFTAKELGFLVATDDNNVIPELTADAEPLYRAGVTAAGNICVALDPSQFAWQWNESSRGAVAQVLAAGREGSFTRFIQTLKPSEAAVTISATASGVTGSGTLLVSPGDPQIIAAWPQCQAACVNVDTGISFNIPMDERTLTPENIGAYQCRNELCKMEDIAADVASGRFPNMVESVTYEDVNDAEVPPYAKHHARLNLRGDLAVGAFYRMRLLPDIKSRDGVSLSKISDDYDFPMESNGQSQLWKSFVFRVRNDDKPCAIESVNVQPTEGTVRAIGSQKWFRASAQGEENGCGPNGGAELLNAAAMSWAWTAAEPAVVGLQTFDVSARPAAGCTAQCLLTGSSPQARLCGNARLDAGEDCDPANGTWCADRCLFAGTAAPTCGNGNVDEGEQCDDGNAAAGDGCSDRCLAEGASATKVTCGNTDIAPGENCDDGNMSAGDGCSPDCIKEGTVLSEAWCRAQGDGAKDRYPACAQAVPSCGNGALESGEACDPPQAGVCSSRCLFAGGAGKESCGNGVLEPQFGEECDDANQAQGDGCEQCLLRGSSLRYAAASMCGDGQVGIGESFRCESNQHGDGRQDPLVLATLQSIAGHEQDLQGEGADEARIESAIHAEASYNDTTGSGDAKLVLQCGFTQADQCPDPDNYGVGSNGCCYAYPTVSDMEPVGDGACRNPALSFVIDSGISNKSLEGNITIAVERRSDCLEDETEIAFDQQTVRLAAPTWWERFVARMRHVMSLLFVEVVNAAPQPGQPGGAPQRPATCSNGRKDAGEVQIDCGGLCGACTGAVCLGNAQCASGSCQNGRCIAVAQPAQPAPAKQPAAQPAAPAQPAPKAGQPAPAPGAPAPAKEAPAAGQDGAAPALKGLGELPPAEPAGGADVKASLKQQQELEQAIKEQRKKQEAARRAAGAPDPAPVRPVVAPARWCASTLQARYRNTVKDGKPKVEIMPLSLFAPNTRYRVIINGGANGVRDARNVPLKENVEWQFSTGPHVCTLDQVRIEPNAWVFSTTQQGTGQLCSADADCGDGGLCVDAGGGDKRCDLSRRRFVARAYTGIDANAREIAPVPNFYDWLYEWSPTQDSIVDVVADENASTALVATKQGKSGDETVAAKATITADSVNNPSQVQTRVVTGASSVKVSACERPWPALVGGPPVFPYEDVEGNDDGIGAAAPVGTRNVWTNFSAWYCMDGASTATTTDNLPALTPQFIQYNKEGSSLLKRFHLLTPDGEAVGIMVRTNPQWLSLAEWYENEFPGQGKLRPLPPIDGFEAAQLADTVYVNAVNYDAVAGTLYANVYVMSMSGVGRARPSAALRNIFDQLVKNVQFTANVVQYNRCAAANNQDPDMASPRCSADVECAGDWAGRRCLADKDKLRRDLTRMHDATVLLGKLKEYRRVNGGFPRLNEVENQVGSFVPFFTTSKWGSWQSALGNTLATRVPEDPVNKFVGCSAEEGYDSETCWNSAAQTFQCNGGNVYQYRTAPDGQAADVWMHFEFFDPAQRELAAQIDAAAGDGVALQEGACVVEGQVIGAGSATCGNDILEPVEMCDGVKTVERCQDPNASALGRLVDGQTVFDRELWQVTGCRNDCAARIQVPIPVGLCTNGVNVCANNQECPAGSTCRLQGAGGQPITLMCVGRPELERASAAGIIQAAAIPGALCGNGRQDQGEQCDDGPSNGRYGGYCNSTCTRTTGYCGDRVLQAEESCDPTAPPVNNQQAGATWSEHREGSCGWDCQSYGEYCGDGTIQQQHETCDDGNTAAGDGCSAPQCQVEPQAPAVCGNGRKEGAEQCDGGERCDAQCRVIGAYCGNGLIDAGEVCDNGDQNGVACAGEYGRQCSFCSADCRTVRFASGPFCGDGQVTAPEVCDGAALTAGFVCFDNVQFRTAPDATKRCEASCAEPACVGDRYTLCHLGETCGEVGLAISNIDGNDTFSITINRISGNQGSRTIEVAPNTTLTFDTLPTGRYQLEVQYINTSNTDNRCADCVALKSDPARGGVGRIRIQFTPRVTVDEASFSKHTSVSQVWQRNNTIKHYFLGEAALENNVVTKNFFNDWLSERLIARIEERQYNTTFLQWFDAHCPSRRQCDGIVLNSARYFTLRNEAKWWSERQSTLGRPVPGEITGSFYVDRAHSIIIPDASDDTFSMGGGASFQFDVSG